MTAAHPFPAPALVAGPALVPALAGVPDSAPMVPLGSGAEIRTAPPSPGPERVTGSTVSWDAGGPVPLGSAAGASSPAGGVITPPAPRRVNIPAWLRREEGAATAEYAIATLAAVGFAGLLVVILRSDQVRAMLTDLIERALTVAG